MTVKVWFVREELEPTSGGPAYELPLEAHVDTLGLEQRQWISGLERTPRFGEQTPRLAGIANYKHVVCEIDEAEAKASAQKARFYRVEVGPADAVERLGHLTN